MRLNLTEAGRRLGLSRTTIKKRVDAGEIKAVIDPHTGWKLIEESELRRYEAKFLPYVPPQELQPSQPSQPQG